MLQFGGSPRIGGFYQQETPGSRLALSASGCRSSILRGDTPVFAPGFGIQRVLNDLERLSRAMFPIWAKECLSNSISQVYFRYCWLLRYVGRVKTRWGWVANRKAAPRMSKPIPGRPSLWGLLPRIAKEPGALPGSWIHGGRYKI